MKTLPTVTFINICFILFTTNKLSAQYSRETELRKLENTEREATMQGDSTILFGKIWSNEMVVNTPANRVGTVEGTKMQIANREFGLCYVCKKH